MEEQTWIRKFGGTKSFPQSNIHIRIDDIRTQTHEPTTPGEATSDAADIGEEDEGSLKQVLYTCACFNLWHHARVIYDEFPDMVRIPLTDRGDTALHVAVKADNSTFVKMLVTLEYMTAKDLEIPNADKNTAFCVAAIEGKGYCYQIMIEKSENLPVIRGQDGMLPVHLAVVFGNHEIALDLTSDNLLEKMDMKDIERLFFLTINSSMYDVAMKLFDKYREQLVVARYDREELTALHMLARQPSEEIYMRERNNNETSTGRDHQLELLKNLCDQVSQLEYHKILELITHPSVVLFDAVKSGNIEAVKWLLYMNSELLKITDPKNGWNLLHFAVRYRRYNIFYFILNWDEVKYIMRAVDENRDNVLHIAAYQPEGTSSLRSITQKQRELAWFKEVEKRVPHELRIMRNRDGKTPKDIYYAHHEKLSVEVKEATKAIATSGMVVVTLIATVAFAAALTVPGDKTSVSFMVFILTNAVALFTSSAAIISFLSISTSGRYAESESVFFLLRPKFTLGLTYFSIIAMVIAFVAASFLIFGHLYKWVAYAVASLALLPVLTFLGIQVSLLDGLRDYFFWSRYYHQSKVQ